MTSLVAGLIPLRDDFPTKRIATDGLKNANKPLEQRWHSMVMASIVSLCALTNVPGTVVKIPESSIHASGPVPASQ